eukprot:CAMPEP_0174740462 /NCGR_PEP_ID=MMETSP1094-20130205/73647_1 /TAXON_ID=156173 /ORGANISM="Chrysochromulina brevifilum, Strain UTEX LB 985" /LENGTH=66 /DNA_ID=CAMNT_0015944169 /DNA_START=119 /DNA_END=316 /DNA_ORIENTATION=-
MDSRPNAACEKPEGWVLAFQFFIVVLSFSIFLILGFVTSHCIDCIWRENFGKEARKRIKDQKQIEQ